MKITEIPDEELRKDLDETYSDILACGTALKSGEKLYCGGNAKDRLETNIRFAGMINAELTRRKRWGK